MLGTKLRTSEWICYCWWFWGRKKNTAVLFCYWKPSSVTPDIYKSILPDFFKVINGYFNKGVWETKTPCVPTGAAQLPSWLLAVRCDWRSWWLAPSPSCDVLQSQLWEPGGHRDFSPSTHWFPKCPNSVTTVEIPLMLGKAMWFSSLFMHIYELCCTSEWEFCIHIYCLFSCVPYEMALLTVSQ